MKNRNKYTSAVKYEIESAEAEYSAPEVKVKYYPVKSKPGIGVSLSKDESLDSLLKRFKKLVLESDIIKKYQESKVFVEPSVKRRLKKSHRKYRAKLASQNYK